MSRAHRQIKHSHFYLLLAGVTYHYCKVLHGALNLHPPACSGWNIHFKDHDDSQRGATINLEASEGSACRLQVMARSLNMMRLQEAVQIFRDLNQSLNLVKQKSFQNQSEIHNETFGG